MTHRQRPITQQRESPPPLTGHILVVDDDDDLRQVLQLTLEAVGHRVSTARNSQQALERCQECDEKGPVDMAILDLRIGREDGLTLMGQLLSLDKQLCVTIMTGYGTVEGAVAAVKQGAFTYLLKPINSHALVQQVSKALERRGLTQQIQSLQLALGQAGFGMRLVGRSPAMQSVYSTAQRVAPTRASVALYGESGTGKEVVAHLIHELSPRSHKPFVVVNCAAIPESLLESQLFGHVKGAFTGAVADSPGYFRQADGGTLLLDEIGETPPSFQVSLLRVLQDWKIRPVGSNSEEPVDVRLMVATHRDLKREVAEGRFREDLFYRVHVLPLNLPPLREREGDIELLAEHFLRHYAREEGRELVAFHADALEALRTYSWPGNVRQLENLVKKAVVLAPGPLVQVSDLFEQGAIAPAKNPDSPTTSTARLSWKEAKEQWEKEYLLGLIRQTRGNVSEAARIAERYRADLTSLLKKHMIDPDSFRV